MTSSVIQLTQTVAGVLPGDIDRTELHKLFVLALFKCIGSTAFSRQLSSLLGVKQHDALELRKRLDNDGYLLFHVKPFLFYCFKKGAKTKRKILQYASDFKVRAEDAPIALVLQEPSVAERLDPLREFKALSFSALRHHIDSIPKRVSGYARHFIMKDMAFIIRNQHYALGVDDVLNELLDKGIRNLLWTYPKIDNSLHALNIVKRAIKNNGVNLIYYHTRDQRGVVCRDDNGNFYSKVIPITDQTENVLDTLVCPTVSNNLDTKVSVEDWIATRQVLRHFKSKRKRTIVTALMGMNSERFSTWLRVKAKPTHRLPNDDLFETLAARKSMSQYIQYLSAYSGYDTAKVLQVGRKAANLIQA
jgi:hypothetical protein